jgi:hypothetical protein
MIGPILHQQPSKVRLQFSTVKKIFLFVLLAVFLCACGQQDKEIDDAVNTEAVLKKPPELTVISEYSKVAAVLGTYSWSYDNGDGTFTGIEADADTPPGLVSYQTIQLKSGSGSDVKLEFEKAPEEVTVNIWDESQIVKRVKVEDLSFKADEKGQIIYEVYAKWDQGTAYYAVKIDVQ